MAVKLGLVGGMLILALWHRFGVMARGGRVGRSLAVETGLGILVLALAMGFRLAPPPALPQPFSLHIHTAKAMVTLQTTGALPGATGFLLFVADGQLNALDPKELRLTLTDKAAGIGPLRAMARRRGQGEWDVAPMAAQPRPLDGGGGPFDQRFRTAHPDRRSAPNGNPP